ncbi:MAG TPA: hypothetical protein VF666_01650 [Pyrinomonadaceae bacterium]
MKSLIGALIICLLLSPALGLAQTRTRRTTPQKRRTTNASSTSRLDSAQANTARIKLGDQIKNLTRFVYLYGRLSKDLELVGTQVETSDATRTRNALTQNLRNIREGLDQLEAQFRLTPGLERHYARLRGVAQRAEDAENMAASNRLDQAGRTLLDVINQLTDVLLEM